jgi:hypothetical protein
MTTDKPPTDDLDEHGFDWHSRRTLAAGLVLVFVAVGAAWALSTGHHKGTDSGKASEYDSACDLTGGTTATPTTGPDVQWQNVDGAWLPISTAQGPGRRSATGAWSCFGHTPTGAVLAAWTISNRMGVATDFIGLIKQQTVPGPGQAIQLKQGQTRNAANDQATPFGFTINGQDASTATVTFYARQRNASLRCSATVQWVGAGNGDWLLRLAADGSPVTNCESVPADSHGGPGFVAWGPNS